MLQAIFEVIFEVVLTPVFGITGHYVLRALTLGRWTPSLDNTDWAIFVGIVFWILVGVLVALPFIL